jgi:hypothetical protein
LSEEEGGEPGDEEDDRVKGEASTIMGPEGRSIGTGGERRPQPGREPAKQWPGRAGGGGHGNPKTRSDTMLGLDVLYSIGAKGHIYIHVQVCKYARNLLTGGEITIYKYTSNKSVMGITELHQDKIKFKKLCSSTNNLI